MEHSLVEVRAYAYAATFRLKELARAFDGATVELSQDELRLAWPGGGRAILFDFGALVEFGLSDADRARTLAQLSARLAGEPHPPLTEEFLVEVDPARAPGYEVAFDRVVVPELTWDVMSIVGILLAQSASMDYYEEDVAEITATIGALVRELARGGRLRGPTKQLVKFIGNAMATKDGIIETLALFDKPDVAWEDEALDKLFVRLRRNLEIDDRFRALEFKLRGIQENLVLFVDLSQRRHSFMLEASVLVLIVIEVLVMLWQILGGK